MGRDDNIAAIRGSGEPSGQGFEVDLHFHIYSKGTKSRPKPYLIFGPVGGKGVDANLSCITPESLWETLMRIGALSKAEQPTTIEATKQAILEDLFAGKVRVEEVGPVTLGEIAVGDLVKHNDGKVRIAVAKLSSGWKLAELTGDRVLSGWAFTTKATLMKLVPAS